MHILQKQSNAIYFKNQIVLFFPFTFLWGGGAGLTHNQLGENPGPTLSGYILMYYTYGTDSLKKSTSA